MSKQEIRILQLIDSLEAGGAERMAVTYANALLQEVGFSALVTTRAEGMLQQQLENGVLYAFLARKSVLDLGALLLLRKLVNQNRITHVHAHSSSVFFAVLLKLLCPHLYLIWHDHYGNSEMLERRSVWALRIASLWMDQIISVNQQLVTWAQQQLWCKKVTYLPNFTASAPSVATTLLLGSEGKRIVCLANLRQQKNHFLLLEVAKVITHSHPEYTFHLVGKDFEDDYASELKVRIRAESLQQCVFLYGSCDDVPTILAQANIGILTSDSEGLPIALLEYGLHYLPVVVTNVGEISTVVSNNLEGLVVPAGDVAAFVAALQKIIDNPNLQVTFATNLQAKVRLKYSATAVVNAYLDLIHEK